MTSSSYPIGQMDILWDTLNNRPKSNMADHSVGAREELHEVEASQALMFCFAEKFRFVADLVSLFAVLRVAVFLNASRKDKNLPLFTSKGK